MRCWYCGQPSKVFRMVAEPPIPRKAFPGVDWHGRWVEWCTLCERIPKPVKKPAKKSAA